MKKIIIILLLSSSLAFSQAANEKKNPADAKKTATQDKNDNEKKKVEEEQKGEMKKLSAKDANLKKRENQLIRNEHKYIADFIEKEYVKANAKKVEKLENDIIRTEKRIRVATNPKQKVALEKNLKKQKAELETFKIWSLYHKAYTIKVDAMQKKNVEQYTKSKNYLKILEKKYKELTAQTFPNIRGIFYAKYSNQIKKMREEKLK